MKNLYKYTDGNITLKIIADDNRSQYAVVWEEEGYPMVDAAFLDEKLALSMVNFLTSSNSKDGYVFDLSLRAFIKKRKEYSTFYYCTSKSHRKISLDNNQIKILKKSIIRNDYLEI